MVNIAAKLENLKRNENADTSRDGPRICRMSRRWRWCLGMWSRGRYAREGHWQLESWIRSFEAGNDNEYDPHPRDECVKEQAWRLTWFNNTDTDCKSKITRMTCRRAVHLRSTHSLLQTEAKEGFDDEILWYLLGSLPHIKWNTSVGRIASDRSHQREHIPQQRLPPLSSIPSPK